MVQYDILIRGGMVIDPASGTQEIQDIYVKDGRIVPPPAPGTDASAEKVIPAEGCIVTPGLIDAHYRGELKIIAVNLDSSETIHIEKGERIAQLVIQEVPVVDLVEVDELDETDRGSGGFGSSGVQ